MRRDDLLTVLLCALLLSPTLAYRMGLDQGTFAYVSSEALKGRWPYLATWDHQFPGGMLLHGVQILLLGRSIVMFRLADFVWQLVNVLLIARITGRLAGAAAGLLAAAMYALIYQGYGPWNTGQREGYALTFVLLAFYTYLTRDRRTSRATAVIIGLCIGFAATIKPTFAGFFAMYAPAWFGGASAREKVRAALVAGGASLLPALAFLGFYWAQDGLLAMYEACIAYQTQVYMHRLRGDDPALVYWARKVAALGPRPLILLIAYLPFFASPRIRRERLMAYAGLLYALLTVALQGTFAGYHFLPALGLGAILIGTMWSIGVERVAGSIPAIRRVATQTTLVLALVAVAIPLYVRPHRVRELVSLRFLAPPGPDALRNPPVFDFYEDYLLAEYLKAHTAPDEPVQVWGHESLVYYLAERRAASRFQSSNPLVMRPPRQPITPMQERWRAEFLRDMNRRPPRYIAVATGDRWWWAPENRTSAELVADFPGFKTFIDTRYRRDITVGKFIVYRLASHHAAGEAQSLLHSRAGA